jgi:hypothetical protein
MLEFVPIQDVLHADTDMWKGIEEKVPHFDDPRNVRLLLVTDGVQVFQSGKQEVPGHEIAWSVLLGRSSTRI